MSGEYRVHTQATDWNRGNREGANRGLVPPGKGSRDPDPAYAGNAPKAFVIKEKEGHGYGKLENNVDLYTQMLAFLKDQFGK